MSTSENGRTRRCPHCGQEIDAASESCPACGTLFIAAQCERHPDRAAGGVCVICGRRLCAEECEPEERAYHVCADHAGVPVIEGWAQLYTTPDEIEAQLIRDNLEAEGIDSEVLSQRDSALSFDLGEFSQVRVLVPAFAYQEAYRLVKERQDARGSILFACPSCGESYQPGEATCRACGADLPRALA